MRLGFRDVAVHSCDWPRSLLPGLAVAASMAGCTLVHPSQCVTIPLLREKGHMRVEANGSFAGMTSVAGDVAVAGSPLRRLGLGVYAMHEGDFGDEDPDRGRRSHLEGMVGYYVPFRGEYVFDVYAGVGGGNLCWRREMGGGILEGTYTSPFLQTNIGGTDFWGRDSEWGLGIRATLMAAELRDRGGFYRLEYGVPSAEARYSDRYLLVEPATAARVGRTPVKGTLRLAFCIPVKLTGDSDLKLPFAWWSIGGGVSLEWRPGRRRATDGQQKIE